MSPLLDEWQVHLQCVRVCVCACVCVCVCVCVCAYVCPDMRVLCMWTFRVFKEHG